MMLDGPEIEHKSHDFEIKVKVVISGSRLKSLP